MTYDAGYDDSTAWDSGQIRDRMPIIATLQDEVLGVSDLVKTRGRIYRGEMISGDITRELDRSFGEQNEMMLKFGQLLGLSVGLQGDRLGVVDAVHGDAEDSNTQTAGSWNTTGGRY